MVRPRILLADDHTMLLEAFDKLLSQRAEVVGKVTNGLAVLDKAVELQPDIIVLDISMPELDGLEAAQQLRTSVPAAKIIFLTVHADADMAAEAMRLGASGYLLKSSAASELFQAIECAMNGDTFVTPLMTRALVDCLLTSSEKQSPMEKLTDRQQEVLQLLAQGLSMKQVAARLNISSRTVAFHKYRMMEELGLHSTAELVRFAVEQDQISK